VNETDLVLAAIVLGFVARDGLLAAWLIKRAAPAASVPVPIGPSASSVPAGPVVSPAPTSVAPRNTNITATTFAGPNDSASANASAYGGMVNSTVPGFALPFHFTGARPTVRIFYEGKTADGPIVDVGPWNINDPYWQTGSRPQAETGTDNTGRRTNLAGIDLTPGAWTALGVDVTDPKFPGKLKVSWDFVDYLDGAAGAPAPQPASGTPAWVTLGRTFNGLVWASGPMPPKLMVWMDHIATTFPDMALYCNGLKAAGARGYWEWCGFFVAAMLSYSNIRPPISAAGLKGEETTGDFAYVDSWLNWGTPVTEPQPGDVLIWKAPGIHHVSFYDHPEPTTDTYASLGGDQSKPLRVCISDINMDYCIAIRRPPA
jgi:hypothetical protein